MKIRTRFAPSPTGYLHLGGLRTALYAYLFTRQKNGEFILRIEDTDQSRFVEGSVEALIRILDRFGITSDEGPQIKNGEIIQVGDKGPYIQSERLDIYQKHVHELIEKGHAYYCFCTRERLDEVRKQQQAAKLTPKYDRACLKLEPAEIKSRLEAGEDYVIRLKVPEGKTVFEDVIRGKIMISNSDIDDQVLMKTDGFPTYHLAAIVDDHYMEITHVIRAEEWLSSTPKHVILYHAFGWDLPIFAHLPLILNPDKSKLSKRQGDVAAEDFLQNGYLPEALINFVALLGFNPKGDQEIYSFKELIELFDLKKVNKGGAVFDREKLAWMNGEYIRSKTPHELVELCRPFLEQAKIKIDDHLLEKIVAIESSRMKTLADIVDCVETYIGNLDYQSEILVWKKSNQVDTKDNLERLVIFIDQLDETSFDSDDLLEKGVKRYIEEEGLQNGDVLWPMRVALSGRKASPSPFELGWALGKEETLIRLRQAVERL